MNERIKELLEQSGAKTGEYYRNLDDPNISYGKGVVSEWSEEFKQQLRLEPYLRISGMDEKTLEKFAKLIVRECIQELETSKKGDIYTGELFNCEWNDCITRQIEMLKEHFGLDF